MGIDRTHGACEKRKRLRRFRGVGKGGNGF